MALSITTFVLIFLSFGLLGISLLGFLGAKNWFCSLLSHFRFQYFLSGIVLLVALLFVHPLWFWLPLLSVMLNAPYLKNRSADNVSRELKSKLRVMSANLFIANLDYDRMAQSILASKADVVLLYEIFEDTFQELKKRLGEYPLSYFDASPRNLGLAVFSKKEDANIHSEHFANLKAATVVVEIPSLKNVQLLGYHTDAPMSPKKYKAMKEEIAGLAKFAAQAKNPLVVLGDFNDTTHAPIFTPLFQAGLKDAREAFQRKASWPLFLPKFLRITLDNVLVKNGAHVTKHEFGERTGSDHEPVIVEISVQ